MTENSYFLIRRIDDATDTSVTRDNATCLRLAQRRDLKVELAKLAPEWPRVSLTRVAKMLWATRDQRQARDTPELIEYRGAVLGIMRANQFDWLYQKANEPTLEDEGWP